MAILAIQEHDAELGAHAGALVVRVRGQVVRTVAVHDVEEVQLYGGAELSAGGRNLLLLRGIDTVFLTMDGRVRGRLVASEGRQGDRRLAHYAALSDSTRRLTVARTIVAGKIGNQRRLLLVRQKNLRSERLADALAALRGLATRVGTAEDLDTLRGLEGLAAAQFFGCFPDLIRNAAFRWEGRNRRPPKDPINAALSYGYTLLLVKAEQAVRVAGLDPYLGVLHEAGRGKPALALDLKEGFRPMVDNLVLTLVNRTQLGPEDFGPPDVDLLAEEPEAPQEGAVYLTKVGRTILLRAWATRLAERSPHPTLDADWTVAGLLGEEARALGRALLDGAAWTPTEIC